MVSIPGGWFWPPAPNGEGNATTPALPESGEAADAALLPALAGGAEDAAAQAGLAAFAVLLQNLSLPLPALPEKQKGGENGSASVPQTSDEGSSPSRATGSEGEAVPSAGGSLSAASGTQQGPAGDVRTLVPASAGPSVVAASAAPSPSSAPSVAPSRDVPHVASAPAAPPADPLQVSKEVVTPERARPERSATTPAEAVNESEQAQDPRPAAMPAPPTRGFAPAPDGHGEVPAQVPPVAPPPAPVEVPRARPRARTGPRAAARERAEIPERLALQARPGAPVDPPRASSLPAPRVDHPSSFAAPLPAKGGAAVEMEPIHLESEDGAPSIPTSSLPAAARPVEDGSERAPSAPTAPAQSTQASSAPASVSPQAAAGDPPPGPASNSGAAPSADTRQHLSAGSPAQAPIQGLPVVAEQQPERLPQAGAAITSAPSAAPSQARPDAPIEAPELLMDEPERAPARPVARERTHVEPAVAHDADAPVRNLFDAAEGEARGRVTRLVDFLSGAGPVPEPDDGGEIVVRLPGRWVDAAITAAEIHVPDGPAAAGDALPAESLAQDAPASAASRERPAVEGAPSPSQGDIAAETPRTRTRPEAGPAPVRLEKGPAGPQRAATSIEAPAQARGGEGENPSEPARMNGAPDPAVEPTKQSARPFQAAAQEESVRIVDPPAARASRSLAPQKTAKVEPRDTAKAEPPTTPVPRVLSIPRQAQDSAPAAPQQVSPPEAPRRVTRSPGQPAPKTGEVPSAPATRAEAAATQLRPAAAAAAKTPPASPAPPVDTGAGTKTAPRRDSEVGPVPSDPRPPVKPRIAIAQNAATHLSPTPAPESGGTPVDAIVSPPARQDATRVSLGAPPAPPAPKDDAPRVAREVEAPAAIPETSADPHPPAPQAARAQVSAPLAEPPAAEPAAPLPHVTLADLPERLPQIVRLAVLEGRREARIQLSPPELGQIQVHLRLIEDQVHARLAVERPEVRLMIEERRGELEGRLESSGLKLQSFEVRAASEWRMESPAQAAQVAQPQPAARAESSFSQGTTSQQGDPRSAFADGRQESRRQEGGQAPDLPFEAGSKPEPRSRARREDRWGNARVDIRV